MRSNFIFLSKFETAKMVPLSVAVLIFCAAFASAYPANDPVIGIWSEGLRYDYLEDDAGNVHLVDNWLKVSDYDKLARYNPDQSNRYHLFTRSNPSTSQPLVLNNAASVTGSNFNRNRRTVVLMHGFAGSATSSFNTVLLPAFLAAGDFNVIVLDWSAGSTWGPRATQAGQAGGRFINWLNSLTGATANNYILCGFSVGGHGVGHMGRTINGNVAYISSLDPADRWDSNLLFRPNDGAYTEVIHTNGGDSGWLLPLGDVDFYPNGGTSMPGCATSLCNHNRAYNYMAESLRTGGFTGRRCDNIHHAISGHCQGATLRMGGPNPKPGSTGLYHLVTNSRQPFSRG